MRRRNFKENTIYSYYVIALNKIGNATTDSEKVFSEFNSQSTGAIATYIIVNS